MFQPVTDSYFCSTKDKDKWMNNYLISDKIDIELNDISSNVTSSLLDDNENLKYGDDINENPIGFLDMNEKLVKRDSSKSKVKNISSISIFSNSTSRPSCASSFRTVSIESTSPILAEIGQPLDGNSRLNNESVNHYPTYINGDVINGMESFNKMEYRMKDNINSNDGNIISHDSNAPNIANIHTKSKMGKISSIDNQKVEVAQNIKPKAATENNISNRNGVAGKRRLWTNIHATIERCEIIGEGTYGIVYRGVERETGRNVALKRIKIDLFGEEGLSSTTIREVSLLRDMNHKNIVALLGISCLKDRIYLAFEYLDMDLKKYMRAHRPNKIPVGIIKKIMLQLLMGLEYCHRCRIIHRDIKPHNILVDKFDNIKIADFGLARVLNCPNKTLTREVVTLWYRAPEILLGSSTYTPAVDIWAAGCVMVELLTGSPLFIGDSEITTLFKIFQLLGTPDPDQWKAIPDLPEAKNWEKWPKWHPRTDPFSLLLPDTCAKALDLVKSMLCYCHKDRISASDAVKHCWFSDIKLD